MNEPLTLPAFFRACYAHGIEKKRVHVQVRSRACPLPLCGTVLEASDGHERGQWYRVDTFSQGKIWAESRNVRLCSGVDGRCSCAEQAAAGGAPLAGIPAAAQPVPGV